MIPILFENNDILAVNKPEGLASIPGHPRGEKCLLSSLSSLFPEKLYVVHRLDKEVSGVILFAKNAVAHQYLNEQFSHREVQKTYLALVHGIIHDNSGLITKPLRQFGSGRMGVDLQQGKASLTQFRVIERFGGYTLVKAYPLTGRRHQIRVHLYSIGHAIVGDLRYGDKGVQNQFPRLMLHAQEITCPLPSGKKVTIEAPLPASFKLVIERIRGQVVSPR
jgi:RluA family pseudouridine synthase